MSTDDKTGVPAQHEPLGHDLTPPQRTALAAMIAGATDTEAADRAGVHRSTVWRWKTQDPDFMAAYRAELADTRDRARRKLLANVDGLLDVVLGAALQEGDVRTARWVLEKLGVASPEATDPGPAHADLLRLEQTVNAGVAERLEQMLAVLKDGGEAAARTLEQLAEAENASPETKKLAELKERMKALGWGPGGRKRRMLEADTRLKEPPEEGDGGPEG